MSPFLSKEDNEVILVDRLSTRELRAKFASDKNVVAENIAEVDVVVGNGGLAEALAPFVQGKFQYAIASHVVEHIPDLVGWLSQTSDLIEAGGRLLLVVPDKRYTFDYIRATSTLSDLVECWVRGCRSPTPKHVFDYHAGAAEVDKLAAWRGRLEPSALARFCSRQDALQISKTSFEDCMYVDSHCWVFTPASFLELCADLVELGLLHWKLVFFADTRPDDEDFGVVLQRLAPGENISEVVASFRQAMPKPPDAEAEIAQLKNEIRQFQASRSWRYTAALRSIGRMLRRSDSAFSPWRSP